MKLREDLALLRPTFMVSVPRLLNRFYDMMKQLLSMEKGTAKTLAEWGLQKKLQQVGTYTHTYYDKIVFDKFKDILGGRVRFMITGSAPIAKDVLHFLKVCFCCPIIEGYGQTETTAPATLTWLFDPDCGQVGPPYPSCEIKLVDVPEMGYYSTDKNSDGESQPRGEVCFKGHCVFKGYYNQPELT